MVFITSHPKEKGAMNNAVPTILALMHPLHDIPMHSRWIQMHALPLPCTTDVTHWPPII